MFYKMVSGQVAVAVAAVALCVATAQPLAAQTQQPVSLARVGQGDVNVEYVRALLPQLSAAQKEALGRDMPKLKQAVQAALLQDLLVRQAEQSQWADNAEAAHAVQRARNAALAESYLAAVTAIPENYPQEQEIIAFYNANKHLLMQPRQLHLAQVFVADAATEDADKQKAAQKKRDAVAAAVAKATTDKDFAALAKRYSDEPVSAQKDGYLGWLPQTQLLPELAKALENVAKGQSVGPVRLGGGWHWLRCLDVREAEPVALNQIRGQLAERMRAERINSNRQNYLARLLAENPIAINELALIQLVRSEPVKADAAQTGPGVVFFNKP